MIGGKNFLPESMKWRNSEKEIISQYSILVEIIL